MSSPPLPGHAAAARCVLALLLPACVSTPDAGQRRARPLDGTTSTASTTSAASLTERTLVYAYRIADQPAGGATYALARSADGWRHTSSVRYGVGRGAFTIDTEIQFDADLRTIMETATTSGPRGAVTTWRLMGTTMTGHTRAGAGSARDTTQVVVVPPDVVFNLQDEVALSVADLAVGRTIAMPVFINARPHDVRFTPTAVETVQVPAGTYRAFRVEVRGYPGVNDEADVLQIWHLTVDRPHVAVRQELPSLRLIGELAEYRREGTAPSGERPAPQRR